MFLDIEKIIIGINVSKYNKVAIHIKIIYNINVNFLNPVFRMTRDIILKKFFSGGKQNEFF